MLVLSRGRLNRSIFQLVYLTRNVSVLLNISISLHIQRKRKFGFQSVMLQIKDIVFDKSYCKSAMNLLLLLVLEIHSYIGSMGERLFSLLFLLEL